MTDSDEEEDWSKPVEEAPKDANRHVDIQKTGVLGRHPRVVLHIDIDCFYAQVEMLRNPELRNKPLGIQQKYIIVTCNYVARERGLSKLMTLKDAKEKCPDLVLVNGEDLTNYRNMSYKISNYLQKYCSLVERLGFDENFLDITELVNDRINNRNTPYPTEVKGHVYREESDRKETCSCGCRARMIMGSHLAGEIRAGLLKELGITCCGGIAYNKLLSKLVAGTHKPNQQTTLFSGDVQVLMSRLTSVRSIQGIGHTSARRLKDLGVATVVDLQNVDMSVLEEEFGHVSAETMKKLCVGNDDSPVIAFGLPQTLSDEDSFKQCSNLENAKARMQQLIKSLLYRLVEDGRLPQTLRLTIRRVLETNRYNNRESRQCNIPSTVFNKFTADNLSHTSSQLECLAYGLFTKMVDTKSSFHLTLINVAFAKLEQKSSNDISCFFSPRKTQQHISVKSMNPTEEDSSLPGTKLEHSLIKTSAEIKERATHKDKSNTPKQSQIKSPTLKSTSGIQKWLVKQQGEIGNKCKDKVEPFNSSDTDFTMEDKQHVKEANSGNLSKRLHSDSTCDTKEENLVKRPRTGADTANHELSANAALLPADLDLSVFLELPPNIQKDILENATSHCMASKNKKIQDMDINVNYTKHTGNNTELENRCSDKQVVGGTLSNKQSTSSNFKVQSFTEKSHDKGGAPVRSNETFNKLASDQSKHLESETITIPPDIDAAVFSNLPPEIKQELIMQWKNENQSKTLAAGKTNRQDRHYFKSPKQSTSSNITNYFLKK